MSSETENSRVSDERLAELVSKDYGITFYGNDVKAIARELQQARERIATLQDRVQQLEKQVSDLSWTLEARRQQSW